MSSTTTSPHFFEAKYQQALDPWNFAASPYELRRYEALVASLQGRSFQNAFEAGCSIGVLTSQLAASCARLHALDVSPTAVARARQRCRSHANVHISVGSLLTDVPRGPFDLIVLSEIGYYFPPAHLNSIARCLASRLQPGGVLLAAHWLGHSNDHLLSGDEVHAIVGALPELRITLSERRQEYRLDHWTLA